MLHQFSGGEAVSRQPLQTLLHEVDSNLSYFLVLRRREQALEAHVGNGVDRVNPVALFVPVNAGGGALLKKRLRRWTKQGVVLGECVYFGPRLVDSMRHNRNFASEHLQGHATDHPNVDGSVEWPSEENFWRSEGLWAAHSRCGVAHVVLWDPNGFAEIVQLWETEAVFGDDERLGFGDRVLVAIFAVVDLASFRVPLQLVHIISKEVTRKAEQNVVKLDVGMNEATFGVQEVKSLKSVHQDLLGKREWKVA